MPPVTGTQAVHADMGRAAPAAKRDFSRRNALTELMDADTDYATFRACLVNLAQLNRLTLASWPTLQFLNRLARSGRLPRDRTISIVDVGSGYGDMLRVIDRWAARRGFRVDLTGVDLNPYSARAAAEATPPDRPIRYVTANVLDYRPPGPIDLVISSIFTHHLDDAALGPVRCLDGSQCGGRLVCGRSPPPSSAVSSGAGQRAGATLASFRPA